MFITTAKNGIVLTLMFMLLTACNLSVFEGQTELKQAPTTTESQITSRATTTTGFQVNGTELLDGKGNPFVMRGVNHPYTWYKGEEGTAIPAMAASGANTVRLVLSNGHQWDAVSASEVTDLIQLCKANDLIAVLEVHDGTGSNDPAVLASIVDYWISIKDVLIGQEDYVIINIANEWYGSWNSSGWADGYIQQIPRLRAAGLTHTLMVDGAGYGQYPKSIHDRGSDVLAADPLGNTMFSIHMYEYAGSDSYTVKNNIDKALQQGLSLVIGEFADDHQGSDVDEATIMSYSETKNVGWLAWSWYGNSDYVITCDMNLGWSGPLTTWGEKAVNGTYGMINTSKTATVFTDQEPPTNPDPDPVLEGMIIDDFNNTSSSDFQVNPNGNTITPTMVNGALQLDYTLGTPSYAGLYKSVLVSGYDSSFDSVQLSLIGDNSGRELVIQFKESDGEYTETTHPIEGIEEVKIPLSNFANPGWYSGSGNGQLDPADIVEYSLYIQGGSAGSGRITLENLLVGSLNDTGTEDPVLSSLEVSSVTVMDTASSVELTADGMDQFGNPFPLNGTNWTSGLPITNTSDTAATIDLSGVSAGSYTVTATVGSVSGAGTIVIEESGTNPPPTPSGDVVKVYYKTGNTSLSTNSIKADFQVENVSDNSLDLSKLTVQYWYTNETGETQIGNIYWTNIGSSNILTTFEEGTESDKMEFAFTGNLSAGSKVKFNTGINAQNWANYDQSNDYSFDGDASSFIENGTITAYYEGTLVWGTPPGSVNPTPTVEAGLNMSPAEPTTEDVITFDATGSTATATTITGYTWSFGSSGVTATKSYTTAGEYTVTLTVDTAAGISDTANITFTVADTGAVIVDPEIDGPATAYPGEGVTFSSMNSVVQNTTISQYHWDVTVNGVTTSDVSTSSTLDTAFSSEGLYTISLEMVDENNNIYSAAPVTLSVSAYDVGNEDIGVVWTSWHPAHFTGTGRTTFMNKVDNYNIKRITLIPTYFIKTYAEGIKFSFDGSGPAATYTPTLETQKSIILELLNKDVRINFRPHIDPAQFSLESTSGSDNPGDIGWRGVFDQLNPMDYNYPEMIMQSLEVLKDVLNDPSCPELKEKIRFDLGAELMMSTKNYPSQWGHLLQNVRDRLASPGYEKVAQNVVLGHNFCHHIEYTEYVQEHYSDTDPDAYYNRIFGDGDGSSRPELRFVDDMTATNISYLADYIKGLDAFSISQYMPQDIFSDGGTTTPADVANALLTLEDDFINYVIKEQLGISEADIPEFHIGEWGIGIRGLAAPNVWDRAEWVDAGHEAKLLTWEEHQQEVPVAIEGLMQYIKTSPRAKSLAIWMCGAPYDILELNPSFSDGDAGHGWPGMPSFNNEASNLLYNYWHQ